MDTDLHFMQLALAEARRAAAQGEVPIGAVVVRAGEVLARAGNAREAARDPTAHAEILALRAAAQAIGGWRLNDCDLYCTIEPCPMCLGACLNARISRVVYGAREPKAGACGSVVDLSAPSGFNHRLEVLGGVAAEDCAALMRSFFASRRRPVAGVDDV